MKLCQQILMAYYQKAPGFLEYDDSFQGAGDQEFWDLPSFPLCNQGWPNEVEIVMEKKVSEYLTHKISSVSEITEAMQRELEK